MKFQIELNHDKKPAPLIAIMKDMIMQAQTNDDDATPAVNLSMPNEIKERFEKLKTEYEDKVIERACQLIRNAGCFNVEVLRHDDGSVTVKGSG